MNQANKYNWKRKGLELEAIGHEWNPSNPGLSNLREEDMDLVQRWCWETNIGKRMSFDTFKFRNEKEMTAFLLRWS